MRVPKTVATSVETAATLRLSFIASSQGGIFEGIGPGVERKRLPYEIELPGWLVEAVKNDDKNWQEQIKQNQSGYEVEYPPAPPRPHRSFARFHARSSVPSTRV